MSLIRIKNFLLHRNQFLILAETVKDKQVTADGKFFEEDISIKTSGGKYGSVIVVDYNLSAKTTLEYTIDGDNYVSFEPIHSADYKKIRVYDKSLFNVKAKGAVKIHHCFVAED